jgi:hypothetical protein
MDTRFCLFGIAALVVILFLSKSIRDEGFHLSTPPFFPSPSSSPSASSVSRTLQQAANGPTNELSDTREVRKEDEAVQELIQRRLTTKGVSEMTETGTYTSDFSPAL